MSSGRAGPSTSFPVRPCAASPRPARGMFGISIRQVMQGKHEQAKFYVNRWRNKARGWQPVHLRLITGLSPGRKALFVSGCRPVKQRLFVSVNSFHAAHVQQSCKACLETEEHDNCLTCRLWLGRRLLFSFFGYWSMYRRFVSVNPF